MEKLESYLYQPRKPKEKHFLVPLVLVGGIVVFALFAWASLKLAAM